MLLIRTHYSSYIFPCCFFELNSSTIQTFIVKNQQKPATNTSPDQISLTRKSIFHIKLKSIGQQNKRCYYLDGDLALNSRFQSLSHRLQNPRAIKKQSAKHRISRNLRIQATHTQHRENQSEGTRIKVYLVELNENLNSELGAESAVLNHLVQSLGQAHSDRRSPVQLERRH